MKPNAVFNYNLLVRKIPTIRLYLAKRKNNTCAQWHMFIGCIFIE